MRGRKRQRVGESEEAKEGGRRPVSAYAREAKRVSRACATLCIAVHRGASRHPVARGYDCGEGGCGVCVGCVGCVGGLLAGVPLAGVPLAGRPQGLCAGRQQCGPCIGC